MAQRAAAGVAGREERAHAHAVRPPQRHVGDGAGAPGRRGRDPPHPDVVALLQQVEDEGFLDELPKLAGGREARDAIQAWLDTYGMRASARSTSRGRGGANAPLCSCPSSRPHQELSRAPASGASSKGGKRRGRRAGAAGALAGLAGRERKAEDQAHDRPGPDFRRVPGYPKYGMISRYFVYKQALLEEAERLVQARVLRENEDILSHVPELQDVVRTNHLQWMTSSSASARRRSGRIRRSRRPGCSRRMARSSWGVPTRRLAGRRAGRFTGFRRDHRGAGPRHPGHGGGGPRSG